MGEFKPVDAKLWQQTCANAVRKLDSMTLVAGTLRPGETALIEESLLKAVRVLAVWGGTHG